MSENITLDPEYADLIIEVNKLKDTVAEKIASRDMLAFHVIPDIESNYMYEMGELENEAFLANIKLLRINRKIELYKENKKYNLGLDNKEIESRLNSEFSDIENEYVEMQDEMFDETFEDDFEKLITSEFLKLVNIIYKSLIKKLSPLINFNNTRLDNQLYELLEKAYRELDLTIMSKLQVICDQRKNDLGLAIGDKKALKRAKKIYENLIDENEEIILNIKCSESYEKKRILEDEKLLNKTKDGIKKEIEKINKEYNVAKKELKKLMSN